MAVRSIKEISHNVIYRAEVSNGVILEASTFKTLWKRAIAELHDSYGNSLYFENGSAQLSWGVLTTVIYAGKREKYGYIKMNDLGELRVFSMDHVTHTLYRKGVREYVL